MQKYAPHTANKSNINFIRTNLIQLLLLSSRKGFVVQGIHPIRSRGQGVVNQLLLQALLADRML